MPSLGHRRVKLESDVYVIVDQLRSLINENNQKRRCEAILNNLDE